MKRSCSMKNLDSISHCSIPFQLSFSNNTPRKSFSLDFADDAKRHVTSIARSLSSFSIKFHDSRSHNSIAAEDGNPVASSESPSVHLGTERITVSLSALDKEIETARCGERRSLSVGDRIYSISRNLDLHDKSDKIPHFCEDLSAFVKEPSFEPSSISYFASRHNTFSEHGSVCSEDESHGTEYASLDANPVKDDQEWHTATDLSEITEPSEELPYHPDVGPEKLPAVYTAIGSVLNFAAHVVSAQKHSLTDEVDVNNPVQELDRQPEMNEVRLKSSRSFKSVDSDAGSPVPCSSSCNKFLPTLSGSSRELSVISEQSDGPFESDENYNTDVLLDEPKPFAEFGKNVKSELPIDNNNERAVDVGDLTVPRHRRWLSEGRNIGRKLLDLDERSSEKKNVCLRSLPSRNGDLSGRCRSQMILEENECIKNWAELETTDRMRSLSSSSPTVSEMTHSSAEENTKGVVRDKQRYQNNERKNAHKWKEALPIAFGPHQVIGPVQRTSRAVTITPTREASIRSTQSEKKARIEKKHSKKSSTFLDFFRKSDLRCFSDVVTPIADRRSVIGEGFDALPDAFAKAVLDKIPNTIGVSDGRFLTAQLAKDTHRFVPQMDKPRWADLDLWSEEPPSWSGSNNSLKISKKERKKQDIIYELYLTEKHHCQVLVILQQVYQEGLRVNGILDETGRSKLIPPVLEALLDFHLNFLRRLRKKRLEAVVVDSISDIVYSEFDKGERNQAAVCAYTEFCSKYDQCGRLYDEWTIKNVELKKFFEHYEQDPTYKGRTFKMCLLLIAQRPTKYPVLLEKISEMENNATAKEESQRAHAATKKFAMHINNEIAKLEVHRRWHRVCSQIDRSSKGRFGPDDLFTFDDLILNGSDEHRRVICIGGAICQNSQKKSAEGTEVLVVLFDDILIMLARSSSNKYVFHDRGSGSSVIALNKLIVRDVPRSTKLFFLVADDPCYDLFVVSFASKADVDQWKRAIEASKDGTPKRVKRATVTSGLNLTDEDPEERKLNQEIASWEAKLRELFDKRKKDERELANYIEKRLAWFELLRSHIKKVPVMDRNDANRNAVREKMKGLVKQKFTELRASRRSSLSRVAERAERMYEDDFMSFFNDAYDADAGTSDSSHSTDQSESEEGRQKLPRRNQTFNGIGERKKGGSVRRHTTEPKMDGTRCHSEEHDSAEEEEIRRLPLLLGPMARRTAVNIIRENAQLRIENNQLQSEIAFRELRIASLKSRRLAAVPASALEALRNKQNELQSEKLKFQTLSEQHLNEIRQRTKELEEKEAELKAREEQLHEQWAKFYEVNSSNSPVQRTFGMNRPLNSTSALDQSMSVRNIAPLRKSSSGISIPVHLAEKTARISRSKK